MRKLKFLFVMAFLLSLSGSAFAFSCNASRMSGGAADDCWVNVQVASNETTLVSVGTVLVFDTANAQVNANNSAYQVRVSTASANGVRIAGVAQKTIASGESALVLVRGKGEVAAKTADAIVSGDALFVSSSGDATIITSNTQNQLGFSLDTRAASGNTRDTVTSYITIV